MSYCVPFDFILFFPYSVLVIVHCMLPRHGIVMHLTYLSFVVFRLPLMFLFIVPLIAPSSDIFNDVFLFCLRCCVAIPF